MPWQGQTNDVTALIRPVDQAIPTPYSGPNPAGQHAGHGGRRRNLTDSLALPAPDLPPGHQFCGRASAHRDRDALRTVGTDPGGFPKGLGKGLATGGVNECQTWSPAPFQGHTTLNGTAECGVSHPRGSPTDTPSFVSWAGPRSPCCYSLMAGPEVSGPCRAQSLSCDSSCPGRGAPVHPPPNTAFSVVKAVESHTRSSGTSTFLGSHLAWQPHCPPHGDG